MRYGECAKCGGNLTNGHRCSQPFYRSQKDYVTPGDRMSQTLRSGPLPMPRAERRDRDLPTSVLVCMVMFAIAGGFVGAMVMWAYMSL